MKPLATILSLPVADPQATANFYAEGLGLESDGVVDGIVDFELPDSRSSSSPQTNTVNTLSSRGSRVRSIRFQAPASSRVHSPRVLRSMRCLTVRSPPVDQPIRVKMSMGRTWATSLTLTAMSGSSLPMSRRRRLPEPTRPSHPLVASTLVDAHSGGGAEVEAFG